MLETHILKRCSSLSKLQFRSLDESGLDRCSEWTLQASPCPVAYRIYRQTLAVPKVLFQMPRALRKCPFEHKRNIFFDIFIQILPDIWHYIYIIYIYMYICIYIYISRSFVWYLHISSRFFLSLWQPGVTGDRVSTKPAFDFPRSTSVRRGGLDPIGRPQTTEHVTDRDPWFHTSLK